jgi:hypothetical protein
MWMNGGQLKVAIGAAVAVSTLGAFADPPLDVLLDQPPDFEARYPSLLIPSGTVKGDDFRPAEDVVVESVFFTMAATWPNVPWTWSFSVHRIAFDHEVYPYSPAFEHFFRMFNPSSVTDLGPWPGDGNRHVFEVRFDNIGLLLKSGMADGGIYWFSCAGHLVDYRRGDRAYWVTSGTNAPQGDEGYTKAEPWDWPGWIRISDFDVPPCDFAMRIEGVPADEFVATTELTDFEVDYGWRAEGDLDDLRAAGDERIVSYRSKPGRRDGQKYYVSSIITKARCLVDDPDVLDVSVSAGVERIFQVPEAFIFLRNQRTGAWDEVGRYDIYLEIVSWPTRDIPAADYLDDHNEIELRFEVRGGPITHPEERFTYFFHTNVDRVRIDARRVD